MATHTQNSPRPAIQLGSTARCSTSELAPNIEAGSHAAKSCNPEYERDLRTWAASDLRLSVLP
jgi:hypothetical protein